VNGTTTLDGKLRIEIEREMNRALSIAEIKTNVNTEQIKSRLKAHYQQKIIQMHDIHNMSQQLHELNDIFNNRGPRYG